MVVGEAETREAAVGCALSMDTTSTQHQHNTSEINKHNKSEI
jgi:hypothetical protein